MSDVPEYYRCEHCGEAYNCCADCIDKELESMQSEAAAEIRRLRAEVERLKGLVHECPQCGEICVECSCYRLHVAELQAEIERLTLRWTDEPPTENAFYWYRVDSGSAPQITEVDPESGILFDMEFPLDKVKGQWSGPIPEPLEPAEESDAYTR